MSLYYRLTEQFQPSWLQTTNRKFVHCFAVVSAIWGSGDGSEGDKRILVEAIHQEIVWQKGEQLYNCGVNYQVSFCIDVIVHLGRSHASLIKNSVTCCWHCYVFECCISFACCRCCLVKPNSWLVLLSCAILRLAGYTHTYFSHFATSWGPGMIKFCFYFLWLTSNTLMCTNVIQCFYFAQYGMIALISVI